MKRLKELLEVGREQSLLNPGRTMLTKIQIDFFAGLIKKEVPSRTPPVNEGLIDLISILMRNVVTKDLGMWGYVHKPFCKALAAWIGNRSVLEVMAGVGWLAKGLSEQGVDIQATDNHNWREGAHGHADAPLVFKVEKKDAVFAAMSSKKDILIMSWPWMDDTAYEVAKAWGSKRPIVYIGEWMGCNANDLFLKHFDTIEGLGDFGIFNWQGLHDCVYIGHYSEESLWEEED